MKEQKNFFNKRGQRIAGIVCLSFLAGIIGGAVMAGMMESGSRGELSLYLRGLLDGTPEETGFGALYFKYLKYALLIWAGGWLSAGLFVSGAVFLFRSVSLGFTSAMLFLTCGKGAFLEVLTLLLPQNLFLVPAYVLMMTASVYYLFLWGERTGRLTAKQERRQKRTEYCILFFCSAALLAVGTGVEHMLLVG